MPLDPASSEPTREASRYELRGGIIEVFAEERSFLDDMLASLTARWRPADIVEHDLVRTVALISLKLVRLDTIEMRVLAAPDAEAAGSRLPSMSTLLRYRARLTKERWEAEHRLRLAIAQRCTNEAEAGAAAGGRRVTTDRPMHPLAETAMAEEEKLQLNRRQRRRLAAARRKAA